MLEICIIIAVVLGCVVAVAQASNKKKKTKTKAKEPKTVKSEQAKPQEKPSLDRSFKIEKQGRLARVSKNALTTNSRTAQVERVFVREPETDKSVYIDDNNHQNSSPEPISLDTGVADVKKNMSAGNAGYFSGNYNGIHLGGARPQDQEKAQAKPESAPKKHEDVRNPDSEYSTVSELLARMRATASNGAIMSEQKNRAKPDNNSEQENGMDFNSMVETDAILNPRYKVYTNRNKKTSV